MLANPAVAHGFWSRLAARMPLVRALHHFLAIGLSDREERTKPMRALLWSLVLLVGLGVTSGSRGEERLVFTAAWV